MKRKRKIKTAETKPTGRSRYALKQGRSEKSGRSRIAPTSPFHHDHVASGRLTQWHEDPIRALLEANA